MNLNSIGWREFFALQTEAHPGLTPGRVAQTQREHFQVWTEDGQVDAQPSGRLRRERGLWPTTGDWVMLRPEGWIEAVLNRQTMLERKRPGGEAGAQILAANLDVLFVVAGLDHDFNPRRLERYMVLARQGGVRPVLVLNKADLHGDLDGVIARTKELAGEIPVMAVSAREGWSVEDLNQFVAPGETAALAGSSGVGKSTLLNRLLGEDRQLTQAVRAGDGRGMHTTTVREMFVLPQGWLLMDLPGIRELQLLGGGDSVEDLFTDITLTAQSCRFRDCRHEAEPGCAVQSAIDPARLASFHKLRLEAAHAQRETDLRVALEQKKKAKVIHKAVRDRPGYDD